MDIIVTIPKAEYVNDDEENIDIKQGILAFWTLSTTPKKLTIGDRVYFIKHNLVNSSMRVVEIKSNSTMLCETTHREWRGRCQLLMDDYNEELNNEYIKGFRGFRYREVNP